MKEETFIHELVHAMIYQMGYDEQDELKINQLGNILYQVIVDNPDVFV